IGSK
ncbi:hypothetical protein VCHENC02_4548B, partial [Vibrio harveyi]